jgi:insertion element IS1 protein InsB
VERYTRRIVAWVLDSRGAATLRQLWQGLSEHYRTSTWYFTDEWEVYAQVLPSAVHRSSPKGSGQTSIVEAVNCALHQKCAVLVRKTCSFSRCLVMQCAFNSSLTSTTAD